MGLGRASDFGAARRAGFAQKVAATLYGGQV